MFAYLRFCFKLDPGLHEGGLHVYPCPMHESACIPYLFGTWVYLARELSFMHTHKK